MNENVTHTVSRALADAHVTVDVEGIAAIRAGYIKSDILPDQVHITYRWDELTERWLTSQADVTGARVLKPGKNGEQRISATYRHDCKYRSRSGVLSRMWGDTPAPVWLTTIVDAARPTGDPGLVGA